MSEGRISGAAPADRTPWGTVVLAGTGLLALVPADPRGLAALPAAAAALVAWAWLERRCAARLPAPLARAADLTVATAVLLLAGAHFLSRRSMLLAVGYVLAGSQFVRICRRKSPGDLMVLNGTAVAQVALAAFLTRSAAFLPILAAAVWMGTLASMQAVARREGEGGGIRVFVGRPPGGGAGFRSRVGALLQPVLVAGAVLLAGAVLFVVLPRGAPFGPGEAAAARPEVVDPTDYSRDREEEPRAITGFSEEVSLGDVGRIKSVPWPAFSARFAIRGLPARLPERLLYFRAVSLDTFDGRRWSRSPELEEEARRLATPDGSGFLPVRDAPPEVPAGFRLVDQEYRLRAMSTAALFALDAPVAFEVGPELPFVLERGDHSFEAGGPHETGFTYRVRSCVPSDPERRILVEDLPPEGRARYLALPPGSERVAELAASVAGEGEGLLKVRRAVAWLEAHCSYTLLFVDRPKGRPVEDFLFRGRTGHCEFFASAMAMLLRGAGVPSRLVVGYRGGQWFEEGAHYLLRQSDAHAWVEAWLPERGWIRVDPTPADARARSVPADMVPGLIAVEAAEPVADRVLRIVRDFDAGDRGAAMRAVSRGVGFVVREGFGVGRERRAFPPPLATLAGLLVISGLARIAGRRILGRTGRRVRTLPCGAAPPAPRVHFYEAAVAALGGQVRPRRGSESAGEYERAVAPLLLGRAAAFGEITRAFEEVRYGGRTLAPSEEAALAALAGSLAGCAAAPEPGGREGKA